MSDKLFEEWADLRYRYHNDREVARAGFEAGRAAQRQEDDSICERIGFAPLIAPKVYDQESFVRGAQAAIEMILTRIRSRKEGGK